MNPFEWAADIVFLILAGWIVLPYGVGQYVAMRFAPEAKWPEEIERQLNAWRRAAAAGAEAGTAAGRVGAPGVGLASQDDR